MMQDKLKAVKVKGGVMAELAGSAHIKLLCARKEGPLGGILGGRGFANHCHGPVDR